MNSMISNQTIKRSLIIFDESINLYIVRFYKDAPNNKIVLIADFLVIGEDFIDITQNQIRKFFIEIKLFEKGDSQNSFFDIVKRNENISLRLKSEKYKLFLSKSDALSITEKMNDLNKPLDVSSQFMLDNKIYDHEWYTMYFILHKLKQEKDCGVSDEEFKAKILPRFENGETAFKPDLL